ncbi:hypothetical protein ACKWTF_007007 [Chironomus riparius]
MLIAKQEVRKVTYQTSSKDLQQKMFNCKILNENSFIAKRLINPNFCFLVTGTFRSAAVIIRDELTEEQKDALCQHIVDAFNEVRPEEIALLIPLLMAPGQFQTLAMTKVVSYLRDELNMRVAN